jgi:hypothetical protein
MKQVASRAALLAVFLLLVFEMLGDLHQTTQYYIPERSLKSYILLLFLILKFLESSAFLIQYCILIWVTTFV